MNFFGGHAWTTTIKSIETVPTGPGQDVFLNQFNLWLPRITYPKSVSEVGGWCTPGYPLPGV